MRPVSKKVRPALAALGVCSALGIAAVPMMHVWMTPEENTPAPAQSFAGDGIDQIVVDFRDNASSADIQSVRQASGLDLQFVSPFSAGSDKLMEATLAPGQNEQQILDSLRRDGRIETAEPVVRYSLPANPFADPQEAWEASKDMAIKSANRYNIAHAVGTPGDLLSAMPGQDWVRVNADMNVTSFSCTGDSAFKPNDPRYNEQWNFQMVGAEDAWKKSRGKGVVVRHRYGRLGWTDQEGQALPRLQ